MALAIVQAPIFGSRTRPYCRALGQYWGFLPGPDQVQGVPDLRVLNRHPRAQKDDTKDGWERSWYVLGVEALPAQCGFSCLLRFLAVLQPKPQGSRAAAFFRIQVLTVRCSCLEAISWRGLQGV